MRRTRTSSSRQGDIPQDGFKNYFVCVQAYRAAIDAHANLVESESTDGSTAALEQQRQMALASGLLNWTALIPRIGGSTLQSHRLNQPASANRLRQHGHSLSPARRIAENPLGCGRVMIARKASGARCA